MTYKRQRVFFFFTFWPPGGIGLQPHLSKLFYPRLFSPGLPCPLDLLFHFASLGISGSAFLLFRKNIYGRVRFNAENTEKEEETEEL
jgi:hypothetical protein